ncbi:hypothetical protein KM176_13475 [Pseudooceanicola sp. CBS1P-1]|nr:hypothetical protein [Pseudooceanicola endophyticus]
MVLKIVLLFLVLMGVLAMFGKLHLLGFGNGRRGRKPAKCPSCGRYLIGSGPCPCRSSKKKG